MRTRGRAFGTEARIRYIPALSQAKKIFTNVSLWKFRWWWAVCALWTVCLVLLFSHSHSKWLFFTSHNSRYAANWFLFSSNVLLAYPPPKKKMPVMQSSCTVHKPRAITFTNCLQSDILEAVALRKQANLAHHSTHLDRYIWKYFQMVQGNSQKSKLSNVHDFNIRFSRCLCYIKTMGLSLCGALDWLKVIWSEHLWDSELFEMTYFLDWLAVKCHFVWVMSQKVKTMCSS